MNFVYRYILVDGEPVPEPDLFKWANWFENSETTQVAYDEINTVEVSTVFLAIRRGVTEPPLLFETMIFGGPLDLESRHYSTRAEALEGHGVIVAKVRKLTKL